MTDVRAARRATGVTFAVHGAVVGSFATRLPWIADRLGTDPGGLGLALLFVAVGAMATMPLAGWIIHRYRIRPVIRVLMTLWCFALILPALAPNLLALGAALFVYGVTSGMSDVAMNAEGVVVEQLAGKSIMSGLHGMWSLGGLLGSGIGRTGRAGRPGRPAALRRGGHPAHRHRAGRQLLRAGRAVPRRTSAPPRFALPPRPVLLIALVGFAAVFAEGAAADWAAVYLTDVAPRRAGPGGQLRSVAFAATMAATRLLGDRVVDRFGPVPRSAAVARSPRSARCWWPSPERRRWRSPGSR